ncbi:MAG: hypothetical protein HY057_12875, partial [Rhodospirillales bacterium]|nr:hypothetical protein [Rhodospirillales bacterium]
GRYETCLARAAREPAEAFEDALAWADIDGGDAARHCATVALLNQGHAKAAAERLETLAARMRAAPARLRADVLAQAGQAWLAAPDPARAYAALSAAIDFAPGNPDLWIDRAETLAAAANYWEAIDDLNKAIDLNPRRGDAFAFRAAAYRYVDSLELAADDAERAVEFSPRLPEAWLERGIVRRLKGDIRGARADWLQVLLLDAEGPAGDVARANIERMELKIDPKPVDRSAGAPRAR